MKRISRLLGLLVATVLSTSLAYAIDWRWRGFSGASNVLSRFFLGVQRLLMNQIVVFGFVLIFMFILLYGILAAALGKVNIFKGKKGGLNKRGKIVAVSMALLSVLAIFWRSNPQQVLVNILSPFGILGGLLLAIVTFLIVYKGFESDSGEKSWKMALATAGLAMILAGMVTSHPNIMWWGWLVFITGAILFFAGAFGGGKADDGYGTPEQFSTPGKTGEATSSGEGETEEEPEQEPEAEPEEPQPQSPVQPPVTPVPIHTWYPYVRNVNKSTGKMDGVVRRD